MQFFTPLKLAVISYYQLLLCECQTDDHHIPLSEIICSYFEKYYCDSKATETFCLDSISMRYIWLERMQSACKQENNNVMFLAALSSCGFVCGCVGEMMSFWEANSASSTPDPRATLYHCRVAECRFVNFYLCLVPRKSYCAKWKFIAAFIAAAASTLTKRWKYANDKTNDRIHMPTHTWILMRWKKLEIYVKWLIYSFLL